MTKKLVVTTLALALAGAATLANAAIVVTSAGQGYAQSFDALASSGTNLAWANDSTLLGWSLIRQPAPGTAITNHAAGNGSGNAGSFYSFGATSSTDRALGSLGSGGAYFGSPGSGVTAGWIAAEFRNDSGQNLSGFSLSFNGEQWRNGGNTSAQTMGFEYGFGSSFGAVSNWVSPGGLFDWASVVNTASAGAVDGNGAGLVAGRGGAVNANWNPNDTLWVRWAEVNDVGNDHGLAIDNVAFTAGEAVPSAVPLPAPFALIAAGLGVLGWLSRYRQQR
ncbi:MAG: PEP-CTERM sorting domain-containing protein [Cytophagales bacterium]|nr:PEP-CTERM sorting domain-containing protein [Rhizobacter sp.]